MEFFDLLPIEKLEELFDTHFDYLKSSHATIPLEKSYNRFCARLYKAKENLPGFRRSQVDGYALIASDSFGASSSLPSYCRLVGTLKVNENAHNYKIQPSQCMKISTGGGLPVGADAVVMIEYTRELPNGFVEIQRPVSPNENVIAEDEDISKGTTIIKDGDRITPFHMGLFAALGIAEFEVYSPIRVGIISSGDELIPITEKVSAGKIRDVNSYTLSALIERFGMIPKCYGIVRDSFEELSGVTQKAFKENDVICISGGSSVGTRDLTLKVIKTFKKAEILFHGITLKPGKPTILAKIEKKPVVGLPGQVASLIVSFLRVVLPLLRRFYHNRAPLYRFPVYTGTNIISTAGREEWIRAEISQKGNRLLAYPRYSKSGVLGSFIHSDGFLIVPPMVEGIQKGDPCDFVPFEAIF